MKIGPKYKIAKRLGAPIFEKCQTQKFEISASKKASVRGGRRPRQLSEYGKQLLEKQKVRFTYGITERQFGRYIKEVTSDHRSNPAEALMRRLETRLDNAVYRLGLAPTRRAARQMVSHGHILVNGRRSTIPSQELFVHDELSVREGSKDAALFAGYQERFMNITIPAWLSWNPKELSGRIESLPTYSAVEAPADIASVLSFYSR